MRNRKTTPFHVKISLLCRKFSEADICTNASCGLSSTDEFLVGSNLSAHPLHCFLSIDICLWLISVLYMEPSFSFKIHLYYLLSKQQPQWRRTCTQRTRVQLPLDTNTIWVSDGGKKGNRPKLLPCASNNTVLSSSPWTGSQRQITTTVIFVKWWLMITLLAWKVENT